jgi:hypothetical protein
MQECDLFTDQDLFQVFATSLGQSSNDASGLASIFNFQDDDPVNASFADTTNSLMQIPTPPVAGISTPVSMQLKQCEQRLEQYQAGEAPQATAKTLDLG